MPVTDAERLRAAGHKVVLAQGEYPLIFNFGALLQLEKDLGGFSGINRAVRRWAPKPAKKNGSSDDPINLHEIRAFLVAGLSHVPLTADEVVGGVLLSEINNYIVAIDQAIGESFSPAPKDGQGNVMGEGQTSSNGTSSTTSPQSATDAATTTSGG